MSSARLCNQIEYMHKHVSKTNLWFDACVGTVGAAGHSNETIKAVHTVGSAISMLTTHHLVSARVLGGGLKLTLRQLAGLNESVIAAAAFDEQNQYRAYAVTTDMQLLLLQVSDQGRRAVRVSRWQGLLDAPARSAVWSGRHIKLFLVPVVIYLPKPFIFQGLCSMSFQYGLR